uniref:HAT C-terminal dimerisation domain-containing protein n=1 Tax=Phaseolus vulgaris TaxID=3885 RepID=V7BUL2_PHAVU|nr:hypothetical protein PHAVU_005G087000g [Phaseolus vulgaris]ESW21639.1 hypothetical protein PHAVU_005G087000g [Phaseolus vulgaris]
MYECLERLVRDLDVMGKIDLQFESFKSKSGLYGTPIAQLALKTKTPSQWRESYGDEHPKLQRFAIRVLSLTCSSSSYHHMMCLHQMTMNDVVFVMTNSRLVKKKDVRKTKEYTIDDLSSGDEWTMEENETLHGLDEDILLEVGEDDASRGATSGPSINDLEVAPIDDDNDLEVPPIDDNENEDLLEEEDDYPMINMNDILG